MTECEVGAVRLRTRTSWSCRAFMAVSTAVTLVCGVHDMQAQKPVAAARSSSDAARAFEQLMARPVTISLTNVPLKRAVDSVARVSNVLVQYSLPVLDAHRTPVSVQVTRVPLGIVLEQLLTGTGIRAVSDGQGHVLLTEGDVGSADSVSGTGTVSGTVTDSANKRPLSSATVQVSGTKLRTMTDNAGRFTLREVPAGRQLIAVRLFGYRPALDTIVVGVGENIAARVVLATAPTMLSQVVTTATGKQRKLEVGNDITALNVDSLQQVAPITSVTDLLEARVPGLVVMRSSGVPGAPSRIRMRGIGSVTRNNDPIVVIDGVRMYAQQDPTRNLENTPANQLQARSGNPIPTQNFPTPSALDQLDPNSIETIEVLKGPSASAIYGSDAGNGVIVITTKRGRNGPTQWYVSADVGLSTQPGEFPTGTYRFGHYFNSPSQLCWIGDLGCTLDSVIKFQALNDPRYTVLGSHGLNREVTGTVSGGTNNLLYSLTGSASRMLGQLKLPDIEAERFTKFHSGLTPPNWMRRPDRYATQGGASRLTIPFARNNAQVELNTSLYTSSQQQSTLQQALSQLAATYVDTSQLGALPLIPSYATRSTTDQTHIVNAFTARWAVTSWLPIEATAGTDRLDGMTQQITPRGYIGGGDSVGRYAVERNMTRTNTLTLGTTIPTRIARLAAGFNYVNSGLNDVRSEVLGIPSGVEIPTVIGSTGLYTSQNVVSTATYGWYVAPQFNFASRFFVSPAIRLDGGSASGTRVSAGGLNGVSGFPKIDFSWLAIDPSKSTGPRSGILGPLTLLRLRTAFGTAGVQPAAGDQLRLFRDTLGALDGQSLDIISLVGLGNTKLRPERSRELEGGFEAELWGGRATLTFTEYQKMRYDAILQKPVAPSILPDVTVPTNVGQISNTGTDLSLSAQLLQRASLGWNVSMSMSHQANRVISLIPGEAPFDYAVNGIDGTVTRIVVGYPQDGRWAKPILGYSDLNHDGVIQPSEVLVGDSLQYVGWQLPNYQLGFNTDVSLLSGRLTLHTQLFFEDGLTQLNAGAITPVRYWGSTGSGTSVTSGVIFFGNDPSVPLGQQAAYAAILSNQTPIGLIQVVNTLRWQNLSVNYVAPTRLAQFVRAHRLTFALQGSNLWLHTNYRGKDPNVNSLPAGDVVQDSGALPLPRTVSLKVTVGN